MYDILPTENNDLAKYLCLTSYRTLDQLGAPPDRMYQTVRQFIEDIRQDLRWVSYTISTIKMSWNEIKLILNQFDQIRTTTILCLFVITKCDKSLE